MYRLSNKKTILYISIMIITLFVFVITFSSEANYNQKINESYQHSSTRLIGFSNAVLDDDNGYIYVDSPSIFTTVNEQETSFSGSLDVSMFIMRQDTVYQDDSLFCTNINSDCNQLGTKEVFLSENILREHQLQIGDSVYLKMDDTLYTFVIKDTIQLYSSFDQPSILNHDGVIIFPQTFETIDSNNQYVYLMDDTSHIFNTLLSIDDILTQVQLFEWIGIMYLMVLYLIAFISIIKLESKSIRKHIVKQITQGSQKTLYALTVIEWAMLILFPSILLAVMIYIIMTSILYSILFMGMVLLITLLTVLFQVKSIRNEVVV